MNRRVVLALFLRAAALLDLSSAWTTSSCSSSFSTTARTTMRTTGPRRGFLAVTSVLAAKKKGFGGGEVPKKTQQQKSATAEETQVMMGQAPRKRKQQQSLNAGQRALEKMRRERAERKDAELRRVRDMLETDRQVRRRSPAIPETVARRMGTRMVPFVGVPLVLGLGSFVAFWYFATYRNVEFQPTVVAATTILLLVVGLLGITYSILSASWDPDREGDLLGAAEFQRNMDNIREGLGRSRENAALREKVSGLSEAELDAALTDLERREMAAAAKREETLESKFEKELE